MEEDIKCTCPWCHKGYSILSEPAPIPITISNCCSKCRRYYIIELETGVCRKAEAIRKI